MVRPLWTQNSHLVFLGRCGFGLFSVCHGPKLCGLVARPVFVRYWGQRVPHGAIDRISPLDGCRRSTACQLLDVDDGLIGHVVFYLARAMVDADHRLARHLCRLGRVGGGGHGSHLQGGAALGQATSLCEPGGASRGWLWSCLAKRLFLAHGTCGLFLLRRHVGRTNLVGRTLDDCGGYTPLSAAKGLFAINLSMLLAFWVWGLMTPRLAKRGFTANRLIAWGQPISFVFLFSLIWLGPELGEATAAALALFCVASTFVALAQPAVGMAFPPNLAGRALSAYNLVIFVGVFVVQWGIGLGIDFFKSLGWPPVLAFQSAFSVFGVCAVLSYVYFHWANRDNSA